MSYILYDFSLFQVSDFAGIYTWLEKSVLPNVYPSTLYNNRYRSAYERTFVDGIDGLRIGPLFLRQKRVMAGTSIQ